MQKALSVTSLNEQIKSLLESTFLHVYIEGEVSRVTYHNSGHLYFTIKDENSSISCVMFRGNNAKMKFCLEEGMSVFIHGSISVYIPRGSYQLNCVSIEPSGSGALALAYEQLKKRLEDMGYFSLEKKKKIPRFIKKIALVTSETSAALQDMIRVANKRWPLLSIVVIDTVVQGESSSFSIVNGIKKADLLEVDVIVVARGGGSIEDLWGFNEERVAHAIFEAKTPIVSAVGHEIDFVISDFVADLRAPTPSAAMEMILPDKNEFLIWIDEKMDEFKRTFLGHLAKKEYSLSNLEKEFQRYSFEHKFHNLNKDIEFLKKSFNLKLTQILDLKRESIKSLEDELGFSFKNHIVKKETSLNSLLNSLKSRNPILGLNDYFAQTVKEGKKVKLSELKNGDIFELQSKESFLKAEVL